MSTSLINNITGSAEYYRRTPDGPIYEFHRDTGQLITLPPKSVPEELITFDASHKDSNI